jgi:predicted nucleic acid-binding protein
VTPADLEHGLELFGRHPELGAFDAVLAAVAISRDARALASGDRAFAVVPELRWIDPGSPALDAILEGRQPS